jgi:nitrite reductase/ring-hydroxylating ferredoxin subunit
LSDKDRSRPPPAPICLISDLANRPHRKDTDRAAGTASTSTGGRAAEKGMVELFVAKVSDFADGERHIVRHEGLEIGVFRWEGEFFAYRNLCLHQGGPACEGLIMHKVEDVIGPDLTWLGQRFSREEVHFVCPWHGYEYDLRTGECAADRRLKLKSYDVVRRGEDVYVVAN